MQLSWLADVLRAQGLNVLEHDGWKTRTNRPFSAYTPVGLLDHHTAGSSVLTDYPGPPWYPNHRLEKSCNITIRGDGTVVVLNAGYAYDSGYGDQRVLDAVRTDHPIPKPTDTYKNGSPAGTNPGVPGNRWFIDIEVQHLGNGDPINPPQRQALIGANTAICERMGWDPRYRLIGHREWTRRKIDPRWNGFTNPMSDIRTDTLKQLEDDMTPEQLRDGLAEFFEEITQTKSDGSVRKHLVRISDSVWAAEVGRGDAKEFLSTVLVQARNYSKADFLNGDADITKDELVAAMADAIEEANIVEAMADELARRLVG